MADVTGPNLLVVGGDTKRLQWLTHHVTSHWPNAQVTTLPAGEPAAVNRLIAERTPDAVILQADFADEGASGIALHDMAQMLQVQPALYCIMLADNGGELSAVRAMKNGAKDYLPLARISRDQLLASIMEACSKRRAAAQATKALRPPTPRRRESKCRAIPSSRRLRPAISRRFISPAASACGETSSSR